MTKFTKGPWQVQNGTDVFTQLGAARFDGKHADSNDGWQIADYMVGTTFVDGELEQLSYGEQLANAKLGAASPDLYEALQGIIEIGKRDLTNPKYDGYFEAARAALSKVTAS